MLEEGRPLNSPLKVIQNSPLFNQVSEMPSTTSWYEDVLQDELEEEVKSRFFDEMEGKSFGVNAQHTLDFQDDFKQEKTVDTPDVIEFPLINNLIKEEQSLNKEEISEVKKLIFDILDKFDISFTLKISLCSQIISLLISSYNSYIRDDLKFNRIQLVTQIIGIISSTLGLFNVEIKKSDLMVFDNLLDDDIHVESSKSNNHLINLNHKLMTKSEILDYFRENNLQNSIKLPSCSYDDLATLNPSLNWIFETYSVSFLCAWYSKPYYEVEILKQKFKHIFKRQNKNFTCVIEMAYRIFGVLFAFIISKFFSKDLTKDDILKGISLGKDFSSFSGDIIKDLFNTTNSELNIFKEQVEEYTNQINQFMETPLYEFSSNYHKIYSIGQTLESISKFIRNAPKDYQNYLFPLHNLYNAASVRKNDILNSAIPEFKRQEPFVILFKGPGAIGKTHLAQNLASKIIREIIPNSHPGKDYIEIRHDDKYWPPLSGQRVAFFDEAGTVNDLKSDLLFNNIKGICSPAYFNCPAADVEHKVTPCPFHIILATTNTDLNDLQGRISSCFSRESVYPTFRRMIVVDTQWNKSKMGELDLNDPRGHRADYSHLKLNLMQWDEQTKTLQPSREIDVEDLFQRIKQRYFKMESNHQQAINMQKLQRQHNSSEHIMHFSLHIHGEPGQGKSPNIIILADKLSRSFNMPVYQVCDLSAFKVKNVDNRRSIFILDDVFDNCSKENLYQDFMYLYNNVFPNNSILIFGSNIELFNSIIPNLNLNTFYFPRVHNIPISGCVRRLGFTGKFKDQKSNPDYNLELYCKNESFFKIKQNYFNLLKTLPNAFFLALAYFVNPLFSIGLFSNLYYYFNSISLEPITSLIDEVFPKYKQFITMRNDINILSVDELPILDYNYKLYIPNLETFKVSRNFLELDKHLTVNLDYFNSIRDRWIMYISNDLATKLRSVYHRFFINDSILTRELILSELKRCARTMLEYGISPCIHIEIESFGTFVFNNNTIYEQNVQLSDSINIYNNDASIFIIRHNQTIDIPFLDLSGQVNLPHKYDLSVQESLKLNQYLNSNLFLSQRCVVDFFSEQQRNNLIMLLQHKGKQIKDKISLFLSKPEGKAFTFLYKFLFFIISSYLTYKTISKLFKLFKFSIQRKGDRKKRINPKYDSDLDEQRKGDRKKRLNPKYDSDLEDHRKGDRKKRINPKYDSDQENQNNHISKLFSQRQILNKQDVKSLCDMNEYDGYKLYIEDAFKKSRNALSQVYIVQSGLQFLSQEPKNQQSCYGMFIFKNYLVSVGHIVKELKRSPYYSLYVGNDKFNGKFYKAELVRSYKHRDLSLWRVDIPFQFPDISNLFLTKEELYKNEYLNACLQRFATKKEEQWIQGNCNIIEPYYNLDEEGIEQFGYVDFSTFEIQLTYFGDCGLPYYIVERKKYHNTLLGIHCMGNVEGYSSIGILALIYKDDILEWKAENQSLCHWCGSQEPMVSPSSTPKCDLHELVWSSTHESSPKTFVEEIKTYNEIRPNFNGLIIKNSGPMFMGSEEHSHTQFLTSECDDFLKVTNGWQVSTAADLGYNSSRIHPETTVSYRIIDISYGSLYNCLNNVSYAKNFRIRANIYNHNNKRKALVGIFIPFEEMPKKTVPEILDLSRQTLVPLPISVGQEVHVCGDIFDICQQHINRYKRGMLPDIPFEQILDNRTVEVLGVTHRNMSPLPSSNYFPTPFHMDIGDKAGIYKSPVRFDAENAPLEIKELLATDRCGNPDGRITASLQWAHPIYSPPLDLRKYCKNQYLSNIMQYYSGINLLTDHQVLHGYNKDHRLYGSLSGLELDSSIGWTAKQIFDVGKKEDVISLNEIGEYSWMKNEASEFLQQLYLDSIKQAHNKQRYWTTFLELLKMEKLKPAKQFTPRSFTANDLNGILMERKILGEFCARAMAWDETVGVGMNPYTDFDKMFRSLAKYKNIFTGDYKRFDRTLPESAFDDIRDNLMKVAPHMDNEIYSCFDTFTRRIQISGNTIFYVQGGMPSGCLGTAPLNSKINDYLIYNCYVAICWDNHRDEICSYASFNKRVIRRIYGDDIIITVSDDISDIFNSITLANKMKILFGMTLTPSSKEGELKPFETWQEVSFISRFFRKLDKYPFYVGALKKISISTHLHWTVEVSDSQMGSQLTICQYEAALWEDDYFNQIQNCIRIAIKRRPGISNYFNFRSRLDIQKEIFDGAFKAGLVLQDAKDIPETLLEDIPSIESTPFKQLKEIPTHVEDTVQSKQNTSASQVQCSRSQFYSSLSRIRRYFGVHYSNSNNKSYLKDRRRFKNYLNKLDDNLALTGEFSKQQQRETYLNMSLFSRINELFQKGEITKPFVSFSRFEDRWDCEIEAEYRLTGRVINASGVGSSKAQAREEASEIFMKSLCSDKVDKVEVMVRQGHKIFNRQMLNVSKGIEHATPGAPMIATDPSIAPDTGIATNTVTVSPSRVINPTACALDNPAGTGAAFDKRDYCYGIYTRWTDKTTTINGSLTQGAEVFRISLDPMTLPQKIKEYILFHRSIIPQIEVQVLIGGAAGSIGWLKLGWVPDDSKKYSLDDLQLVAAEELNLNNTLTMSTILNDNRKSGLFRYVENDPEPWPALVLMVDHPALNVQRNDDVNYPVFVNVRLGPNCMLMQPYNNLLDGDSGINFNKIPLDQHIKIPRTDLLIGSSLVPDIVSSLSTYPDCGFNTGTFSPTFDLTNLSGVVFSYKAGIYQLSTKTGKPTVSSDNFDGPYTDTTKFVYRPRKLYFGYGSIPTVYSSMISYGDDLDILSSSIYTISPYKVKFGIFTFQCSKTYVFDYGIILEFEMIDFYIFATGPANLIKDNGPKDDSLFFIGGFSLDTGNFGDIISFKLTRPFDQVGVALRLTSDTLGEYESLIWFTRAPKEQSITFNDFETLSSYQIIDPSYTFNFVQTGNTTPSSQLPLGIKFCALIRPGTTTTITTDAPFIPLNAPGINTVFNILDSYLDQTNNEFLKMDVIVDGRLLTTLAYSTGYFLCRSSQYRQIRPALSNNIVLDNIVAVDDITGIASVPTAGFNNWAIESAKQAEFVQRFSKIKFQRQAALVGASAAGGLFNGLTSALGTLQYQSWARDYQERGIMAQQKLAEMQGRAMSQIQELRNQGQLDLSKQNFEQRMSLLGRSSPSAQANNNYQNSNVSRSPMDLPKNPNEGRPLPPTPGQENTYDYIHPMHGRPKQENIFAPSSVSGQSNEYSTLSLYGDTTEENYTTPPPQNKSINTDQQSFDQQMGSIAPQNAELNERFPQTKNLSNGRQFSSAVQSHPDGWGNIAGELKSAQMSGKTNI